MSQPRRQPVAIVIEPNPDLAATVAQCLATRGFIVSCATTHAGAAELALAQWRVDFLVAAVPAPGEDRHGAYLSEAAKENPGMGIVIMLADPYELAKDAPSSAVHLVKPFSVAELDKAIDRATIFAAGTGA
ncbi:response regulator transcription factor [Luteibacter pinisoli]|jgi:DNA-binding response OmpR family regulator|uniref:Response regulator transcription factor n=1 Tax=Luteibacter pinisoli TaxID=2589080 RepID=A0A4Y5Z5P2_9GAMM|nr:response regulator transcription factor [Luteibacter pinisoli]QDE39673.1 response regulator transcription factor [Luteibacter pinisoli]